MQYWFANFFSLPLLLFSATIIFAAAETCPESISCSRPELPFFNVRFPFQLTGQNNGRRCVFPGFDLRCNDDDERLSPETLISLPSGDFVVKSIDYQSQTLTLADPSGCLERRFLQQNFTLEGTHFRAHGLRNYTFLSCTKAVVPGLGWFEAVPCLGGSAVSVVAQVTALFEAPPPGCEVIGTVLVPVVPPSRWRDIRLSSVVELDWAEPGCSECERRGGNCGFAAEAGLEIGCLNLPKQGLSKATQYVLFTITGLVVLGFLCFSPGVKRCLARLCHITRAYNRRNGHLVPPNPDRPSEPYNNQLPSQTNNNNANNNNNNITRSPGLDKKVIEMYPMSLVGESRQLLNSNYKACPIFLSEYRSKDILRTLPDCFHYFHADCIDEWLKMNASCPLCRNSPSVAPYTRPV